MKKALIVATIGGFIAGFEYNDCLILKSMGYEVHAACNMDGLRPEAKKKLDEASIILHQIDFARSPYSKKNLSAYVELKKLFSRLRPDLVHCHTPMGGVLARICARKYRRVVKSPSSGKKVNIGTKVIYTAHGFHFFKGAPLKNWLLYYPVELICSYMTDMIITINKEDYRRARRSLHAGKVRYIPGVGVDLKRFKSQVVDRKIMRASLGVPEGAFMMLSVGELSPRKNHQVVIKAVGELQDPNIYYCIAGTGNSKSEYETLIKKYHLQKNVFLLGYRSDIPELLSVTDCFVHPSVREGLGMASLEAMAAGLPLISSYIHGIKDYTKDGVSGCCCKDPLNVKEMKKAIIRMREDEDFRKGCGKNNRIIVKKFSIEKTGSIMHSIYQKV